MDDTNLVSDLASRMPKNDREAAASLLSVLADPELGLKLELSEDQRDQALHAITPFLVAFAMNRHLGWITRDDPTRDLPEVTPGDGWHRTELHRHEHAPQWKAYGEVQFIEAPLPGGRRTYWTKWCCGQRMRRVERLVRHVCTVCRISEWATDRSYYAQCDRCDKCVAAT